jgi:hypothetical protein
MGAEVKAAPKLTVCYELLMYSGNSFSGMKNIRILLIILLSLALTGCQKDEADKTVAAQDVTFGIQWIGPDDLKTGLFDCPVDEQGNSLEASVIQIEITDTDIGLTSTFTPQIFVLGDKLYSQAIKLVPGNYIISKFLLLTEIGGTIVMAVPEQGSEMSQYVINSLDFGFAVSAFSKNEISIQVLCFEPARTEEFGFFWLQPNQVVVRQQCFFGDLCVKDPQDYAGSLYENQLTGLQIDMPAIFRINVKKNGIEVPNSPFTNASLEAGWGVGAPVCVEYADDLNTIEVFTFDLWILVRVGSGFQYQLFHTWNISDDEIIDDGGDGIIDFVLGNCNFSGADLQLAPYQNLPQTASITISYPGDPGYWGLNVNSVFPAGNYDLPLGSMTGWCGDQGTVITPGTKNMYIYSSLYNNNWPAGMPFDEHDIAKVNWLFNNLGSFSGFESPGGYVITSDDLTVDQGLIIQQAIWGIVHGTSGISGMALDMANAAVDKENFSPLPGGWAAILCVAFNKPVQHQLIFTMVDP